MTPEAFVRANTAPQRPPLVPELRLLLASELVPLWQMTEDDLAQRGLPPPYWAFAWAGGQALARLLLDEPQRVQGRRVLEIGCGSGLVAIASAMAGAESVRAADVDRYAVAATHLNAGLNAVEVAVQAEDLVGKPTEGVEILLLGDLCYDRPLAERMLPWLEDLAENGTEMLIGDPMRSYLPRRGLERIARYSVPTSRELEDSEVRDTGVYRVAGALA